MSGFFASLGRVDPDALDAVIGASSHRGVARAWKGDGIAMISWDGALCVSDDLVVAADARLDERFDKVRNDATRIAEAWRRWGPEAVRHLYGDFAAAVWDRRRGVLHVLRDPATGRHALTAVAAGRVLAGSSIPMLLADPAVAREIDDGWIASYHSGRPGFATATGYRAITRLQPGWVARAEDGRWIRRRAFDWQVSPVREASDAAYAERFLDLLREAVRCRIDGAERIGVSLSGGLDSTAVAAAARLARPEVRMVALSVPFTDPSADEQALQRATAERLGMDLRWAPLDGMSPFGAGPEAMIDMLGVPPVAPNQFFVDAVIREGGDMDVVLDGIDGDAALGGNWNYLSDLAVTGRWIELKRELAGITAAHRVPVKALARHYVAAPLRQGHLGRAFDKTERLSMSPDVAPAVLETIDESWARAGVRVAHPFMDRRLVEFCLGLPRNQKIRKGITKFVLRTAMRDMLPMEVTERAEKAELGSAFFAATFGPGKRDVDRGLRVAAAKGITGTYGDAERLRQSFAAGNSGLEAFREAFIALWRVRAGAPGSPLQNWKGAFGMAVSREAAK